jgi:hypothetical protein
MVANFLKAHASHNTASRLRFGWVMYDLVHSLRQSRTFLVLCAPSLSKEITDFKKVYDFKRVYDGGYVII